MMLANRVLVPLLWLASLAGGNAGAFTLTPTRLELDQDQGVGVVTLENSNDSAGTFTIRAFSWERSDDPISLKPTDDLISVPPVFEVEANQSQLLRVGLRGPLRFEEERTYRIIISKVSPEVGPGTNVELNYQVNMPIYVKSKTFKAKPIWALQKNEPQSDRASLILANIGNAHLRPRNIRLLDGNESKPVFELDSASVLFAGEQRSWQLDVSLSDLKGPLNLTADTNIGSIETTVPLPES